MRSWTGSLASGVLVSLAALGCSSGQTGSPRCGIPESCVCRALDSKILLTGTLATFENGSASVLVSGWVSSSGGQNDIVLGNTVGGTVTSTLGCGGDSGLTPAVGDEVFAAYERGTIDQYPACAEYQSCTNTRCGPEPAVDNTGAWDTCDGQCVTETVAACAAHRTEALLAGSLVILPKTEPMLLAGEQVGAADLADLHQRETCELWFPPPPAGPCDDTVEVSNCALSPGPTRFSAWALLLGLATCVAALARSRRD